MHTTGIDILLERWREFEQTLPITTEKSERSMLATVYAIGAQAAFTTLVTLVERDEIKNVSWSELHKLTALAQELSAFILSLDLQAHGQKLES